jgi:hypothetical protein
MSRLAPRGKAVRGGRKRLGMRLGGLGGMRGGSLPGVVFRAGVFFFS